MELESLLERYRSVPLQLKIVVLLLVTLLVGGYSYMENVERAVENLTTAEAEMAELDKQVASLNAAGQNIVAVQSEMRKADEEISMLIDLLPTEPEMERVLGFFAAAAKETGVEIKDFEPAKADDAQQQPGAPGMPGTPGQPPVPATPVPGAPVDPKAAKPSPAPVDENVRRLSVKVKLSGTYPQLMTFFDKVLGIPRVLRMTTFELKTDGSPIAAYSPPVPGGRPAPEKPIEQVPPKLVAVAEFDAYSQKGLLDQFKKEAAPAPAPALPPPGAPNAIASPPADDTSLSAKPLGGPEQ